MIAAKKNSVIGSLFAFYHKRLLKKHFFRIHLNGRENLANTGRTPAILAANHSNWWDGFLAYFLTNRLMKCDDYLMMDIEQLKRYSFFRYIGVFSVDRKNPAEAMRSINYAADIIKDSNRCLWIFPQGEMTPQDKRPLVFYSGISKIAERAGKVKTIPVAIRYEFLMEQRPEVFISIGKPVESTDGNKNFTTELEQIMTKQLDDLKNDVTNGTGNFEIIFTGKSSRNKSFD
ncbi:MAG: lysophospholipid acyltransferase family protein [Ignavibacteria bacterium]|nr:lysophospholipid acyltransferase family protein [Ignavibacteria bacterium]